MRIEWSWKKIHTALLPHKRLHIAELLILKKKCNLKIKLSTIYMNLGNITLSEISQKQKDKYCISPFLLYGITIKKKKKTLPLYLSCKH